METSTEYYKLMWRWRKNQGIHGPFRVIRESKRMVTYETPKIIGGHKILGEVRDSLNQKWCDSWEGCRQHWANDIVLEIRRHQKMIESLESKLEEVNAMTEPKESRRLSC